MCELSDIKRKELAQHKLWLETDGIQGKRLDWCDANLYNANLYSADLRDADLGGAYLRSADLRDADLGGAYLCGADLRGANLRSAYLCSADLRDADLGGAYLCDVKSILTIMPIGSRDDMLIAVLHPEVEGGVMLKTGCFWGTLAEFAAANEKAHGNDKYGRQYKAAIELIKVWVETQTKQEADNA